VLLGLFCLVLLAGCCGFTADKRAAVQGSLELLQGGYDTSVGFLEDQGDQGVDPETLAKMKMAQGAAKLAVPLMDAALDQLGQLLDKQCPTDVEVTAALAKAQAAVTGLAAPAANPTAAQ
jgi:hypothetical protein